LGLLDDHSGQLTALMTIFILSVPATGNSAMCAASVRTCGKLQHMWWILVLFVRN
jgi:hypothetical protein